MYTYRERYMYNMWIDVFSLAFFWIPERSQKSSFCLNPLRPFSEDLVLGRVCWTSWKAPLSGRHVHVCMYVCMYVCT